MPLLLVGSVAVAFWPAFAAGFVNWDDPGLLVENPRYRGLGPAELGWMLTTFHMGHFHPLTWLSFAIDHALWGMEPRGYHLTNVVLHAANAVVFWALARRVLAHAGTRRDVQATGALLAALLFALHPLRVESVAWVTERRDVLSTLFLLLTVLAWLRFQEGGAVRRRWYAIALGCFVLSLLSKAWAITLPAVLLVLDVWPLRRRRPVAALVLEKLPFIAVAGGAAVLALVAQRTAGAMGDAAELGVLQRTMQALYGLAFYVRKSLVPTGLSPVYLLDPRLDPAAPRYLLSAAGVLAAAGALVAFRRRSPGTVVAFVCYAILVSPVLGFAQSGVQLVADRYAYVASLPLALLAGAALATLARAGGRIAAAVSIAVVATLGIATWRQTQVWHDSLTLWNHALALDPDNWLAHNSRGLAREQAGDPERAAADFDAAVRAAPGYAMAYNNRGRLRVGRGDVAGAIADWDRALALAPGLAVAALNRGAARLVQGDTAGAIADLETATRLAPGDASAWYNLATAHTMAGRLDLAIEDCGRALALAGGDDDLRARAQRKLDALRAEQARVH